MSEVPLYGSRPSPWEGGRPLSSEYGTYKTVTARFWHVKVIETFEGVPRMVEATAGERRPSVPTSLSSLLLSSLELSDKKIYEP